MFLEKSTPLAMIYTATDSDGMDKSHLCQGVGLKGPKGSRGGGGPIGSQAVKGLAYRVPRGPGAGLQRSRGRGKMSHRINSDI